MNLFRDVLGNVEVQFGTHNGEPLTVTPNQLEALVNDPKGQAEAVIVRQVYRIPVQTTVLGDMPDAEELAGILAGAGIPADLVQKAAILVRERICEGAATTSGKVKAKCAEFVRKVL